jgi:acyl-CoA thioesterase FadM
LLEDDEVTVTCRGIGYGTSSVRTHERVYAKAGWLAAEAESVVVAHDPEARASRPLTDDERARLDVAIAEDADA